MKKLIIGLATLGLAAACSKSADAPGKPGTPSKPDMTGTPILPPTAPPPAELTTLRAQLASVPRTADELLGAHAVQYLDKLPYDPSKATNLPLIQASPLALGPEESAALQARGFAIGGRTQFVTFIHGY